MKCWQVQKGLWQPGWLVQTLEPNESKRSKLQPALFSARLVGSAFFRPYGQQGRQCIVFGRQSERAFCRPTLS
eukprot:3016375-Amphidinium_carterae.1